VLGSTLGLAACVATSPPEPAPLLTPTLPGAVIYQCTGGAVSELIEARYDTADDAVSVLFNDVIYKLPQTPSGSGSRYSNGSITWWTQGTEALWQMDENLLLRDCRKATESGVGQ
jgi:membrane-bound inhibitor of C-type lysozyme